MRRGLAACVLLLAGCSSNTPRSDERLGVRTDSSNRDTTDWSNISADAMIEKYGPPDRVELRRLVWEKRGPWKRIAVWDELCFVDNGRTTSNVEGAISYAVPDDKREALADFSPGLHVSSRGEELSVRSKSEERNFLMLNLADDVVKGRLTPEEARMAYLRTLRLAESGKTTPAPRRPKPRRTRSCRSPGSPAASKSRRPTTGRTSRARSFPISAPAPSSGCTPAR